MWSQYISIPKSILASADPPPSLLLLSTVNCSLSTVAGAAKVAAFIRQAAPRLGLTTKCTVYTTFGLRRPSPFPPSLVFDLALNQTASFPSGRQLFTPMLRPRSSIGPVCMNQTMFKLYSNMFEYVSVFVLQMGLGKTLQALCIAYYYRSDWPLLIVVPSSLRYPWIEELEKWFPSIPPDSVNLIESGSDIE